VPLKVVASSLDSLRSEVLADFACPRDLQESLKASALVPELAGPPRLHRGHRCAGAGSAGRAGQSIQAAGRGPTQGSRASQHPAEAPGLPWKNPSPLAPCTCATPPTKKRFVDGAVFEPIPVKSAVRDGCTHVLALCSRPADKGPAWGRLVKRTLVGAVKHFMLSPVGGGLGAGGSMIWGGALEWRASRRGPGLSDPL
jgi:hypothetical protein